MSELITGFFTNLFENIPFGKDLCVLVCSMIPIVELRGGIPLGAGLGLPWWRTMIMAVFGNMIPVPFILLLINWIISFMAKSRIKLLNRIGNWLNKKAEKNRPKIEKYGFWGICIFVAIPLPVTGAWTGSLVCATIREKFWRAVLSCLIGVCIASIIMTLASYGVVAAFSIFA